MRGALIGRVRALFNDADRGEAPVVRSTDALYPPGSVIWRVHGDVTSMMIGGVSALLMQMLHPAALAGVWDHSSFRGDMLGRLRRTARFIAVTTYGERTLAEAAIEKVRAVHLRVTGTLADGTPYRASDPRLLAWVHACEALCFLDAWIRYGEPGMTLADQDRYFAEAAGIAVALGADPVPTTRAGILALIASFRCELVSDARTGEVATMVLAQPAPSLVAAPVQKMLFEAAVDLLPRWARQMHGRDVSLAARPLVRTGSAVVAGALRWAFAPYRGVAAKPR